MIDFQAVFIDSLWLVGLAGVLVTFSYQDWRRSVLGRDWRHHWKQPAFQRPLTLSLTVFSLGLTLNGTTYQVPVPWWQTAIWTLMTLALGVQTLLYGRIVRTAMQIHRQLFSLLAALRSRQRTTQQESTIPMASRKTSHNSDNRVSTLTWGIFLVLTGIGLLLFNLNTFTAYEPYIQYGVISLLGLFALGFFGSYLAVRSHHSQRSGWRSTWWRLILGWTLIALAVMVYLSTLPAFDQRITACVLFIGQAIAFAHVYLLDRSENWWAVIPGGFMLVLGGTIALSSRTEDPATLGTVLFVGMGAVFFLLYLLGQSLRLWWSLIPGSVLVLFGLFLSSIERSEQNVILHWWPVLLILLGGWLSWRATRGTANENLPVNTASNLSHSSVPNDNNEPDRVHQQKWGEYGGPAPGASVELLPEPDEH